jgi:hypothetical protein
MTSCLNGRGEARDSCSHVAQSRPIRETRTVASDLQKRREEPSAREKTLEDQTHLKVLEGHTKFTAEHSFAFALSQDVPKVLLVVEIFGGRILQAPGWLASKLETLPELLELTWVCVEKAEARDCVRERRLDSSS